MAQRARIDIPERLPCHGERGWTGTDRAHEESDRYSLIETLGEACVKTGWLMHAWNIDGQFAARRYDKGASQNDFE